MFDAVEYLNAPRFRNVSLGLERTSLLLELLGNPQKNLKCVHVAGTNGKGSVCAFLESIFRCAGLKTGLFTSPYIHTFEERIRVNNANIDKLSLTNITLKVRKAAFRVLEQLGEHPTEFELMTAVAFVYFAEQKCDVCVIEVGLGGRLDSTNVITPEISVITKIGIDHTEMLGNTISEIAYEKAGIIKPGIPVVTCTQKQQAMQVIKKVAKDRSCEVIRANVSEVESKLPDVFSSLKMKGAFQLENASLAIATANQHGIDDNTIMKGIKSATWLGRFEIFTPNAKSTTSDTNVNKLLACPVIVDGAHNVDGVKALIESLQEFDFDYRIAVFGAMRDKDVAGMLKEAGSSFNEYIVYEPNNPRAMNVCELSSLTKQYARTTKAKSANTALDLSLECAQKNRCQSIIVCFGSLYSIGELRSHLKTLT